LTHTDRISGGFQRIIRNQLAALDGLKEGIMQLPRHSRAFCQSLVEAGGDGSGNSQNT